MNVYNVPEFTKNMTKREGENLISQGHALIDTSNRTKDLSTKSALALASKNINFTVLMLSATKKKVFKRLENQKHPLSRIPVIVHSVKLYYALSNNITNLPKVHICGDGFNVGLLKHYLKAFLKDKYDENKIQIYSSLKKQFGKKNLADRLAWSVTKKGVKSSITLDESHFERLGLLK